MEGNTLVGILVASGGTVWFLHLANSHLYQKTCIPYSEDLLLFMQRFLEFCFHLFLILILCESSMYIMIGAKYTFPT